MGSELPLVQLLNQMFDKIDRLRAYRREERAELRRLQAEHDEVKAQVERLRQTVQEIRDRYPEDVLACNMIVDAGTTDLIRSICDEILEAEAEEA